jgi:hypothetical protein
MPAWPRIVIAGLLGGFIGNGLLGALFSGSLFSFAVTGGLES